MSTTGIMFECSCGEIFYGEEAPEECSKCKKLGGFVQLPEEIVKEREEDIKAEEFEDGY